MSMARDEKETKSEPTKMNVGKPIAKLVNEVKNAKPRTIFLFLSVLNLIFSSVDTKISGWGYAGTSLLYLVGYFVDKIIDIRFAK